MNNIKELRLKQHLTQKQLSYRSGLSQSYINELENGKKTNPSIMAIGKLAAGLHVPVAELLELKNKFKSSSNRCFNDFIF